MKRGRESGGGGRGGEEKKEKEKRKDPAKVTHDSFEWRTHRCNALGGLDRGNPPVGSACLLTVEAGHLWSLRQCLVTRMKPTCQREKCYTHAQLTCVWWTRNTAAECHNGQPTLPGTRYTEYSSLSGDPIHQKMKVGQIINVFPGQSKQTLWNS